jgi:hypothetical protein
LAIIFVIVATKLSSGFSGHRKEKNGLTGVEGAPLHNPSVGVLTVGSFISGLRKPISERQ